MESGMMKVVFSSIRNGSRGELPANEAKKGSVTKPENSFKPKIKYARPEAERNDFQAQSSREVFAALINASNCANLQDEKALEEYITFAPGSVLNKKYF
jgi:hypothetical protein